MRMSVYAIYVVACLLAVVAAILSGVFLINTFDNEQRDSEASQQKSGVGQVTAFQTIISNQMQRMRTVSDSNARQFFQQTSWMAEADYEPQTVISATNSTIFSTWLPSVKAVDQLNGYGLVFLYTNKTTGVIYDRSFVVYWDYHMNGQYEYDFAFTYPEDGLCHAWRAVWDDYAHPVLVEEMYAFDSYFSMADTYKKNDFYGFAQTWSSSDGNSYWYFTHQRAFFQHGIWIVVQSYDVGISWLDMMRSTLTAGANFVAFDSWKHVMATTNADEARRLAECRGTYVNGVIPTDCINASADQYPIQEIRDVYAALHTPAWEDLTAGPINLTTVQISLGGRQFMAISGTLFAEDNLRTIIVWYQPWVNLQTNSVGLTALICILTVLSTFVLTLLGVFGVLRPLMLLGGAMRAVAQTLKEGDHMGDHTVYTPRKPSLFWEVDQIGKDFETIVVDFLGFSSSKARDNKQAPKDTNVPFAVVFTDIQASTALWGRDPAGMSRCVQAHHELIRQLIRTHELYEVKTVGDSFMVTTSSAHAALRFALDVQTTLYDHDWSWAGADEFYREATLAFTKVAHGLAAGAECPRPEYADLWNGLRVRVGIHYGLGEVTYDEVSKGYDYYGTVVNAAARIESLAHGGQVVVSQDVLNALPTPPDPLVCLVAPLGVFPLRGVPQPPILAEVRPTRLQERMFPPLRVHREAAEAAVESDPTLHFVVDVAPSSDEFPAHRTGSPDGRRRSVVVHSPVDWGPDRQLSQMAEELARTHSMVRTGLLSPEVVTQQLLTLYRLVEDLLKPLAPAQHATVAKALAKGWGVPAPVTKADFGGSALRLVNRLSETTKAVTYLKQWVSGGNLPPRQPSACNVTETGPP
eukprot:EG_transcript_2645